jgi:hypothetical protein
VALVGVAAAALVGLAVWMMTRGGKPAGPPDGDTGKDGGQVGTRTPPPGGLEAIGDATVTDADGRVYYRDAVLKKGGLTVPFRVACRTKDSVAGGPDRAFYVMTGPVSNRLYAAFEKGRPADDQPATGMTPERAEAFARWLGGKVPTAAQWDKAAGLWDRDGRAGPSQGFGGGWELTRDRIKAGDASVVELRGERAGAKQPLTYDEVQRQQKDPFTQFAEKASPFTTFRVVIEP